MLKKGFKKSLVVLFAILFPPTLFLVLPHVVIHKDNDFKRAFFTEGFARQAVEAWSSVVWTRAEYWYLVATLFAWGSVSILFLGGRVYHGPPTNTGFRPEYTHSGFRYYILSMLVTVPLIHSYPMLPYYYDFVSLIGVLVAVSFPVGWFLYLKGMISPSPGENYVSGNPVVDFYHGIELYPRLGSRLDLKTLINCRICLFLLQIIYLACWKANAELNKLDYMRGEINWAMTTVTLLQTVYLAKWFKWEDGELNSFCSIQLPVCALSVLAF